MGEQKIKIYGKDWAVRFTTTIPKGEFGYCTSPDHDDRHVAINSRLGTDKTVAVICHELAHACLWPIGEEAVEELGEVVAQVLLNPQIMERLGSERVKRGS